MEVIRDYNYYIFKICLPILLILSVAWSALWLSPKEIETQVTITVVCLLSLIAYNFIIDKDLPKLSYLTFMDKFILTSYFYAGLPTFISIIGNNNLKKGKNIIVSRISFYSKTFIPISYILLIMLIYNLEII